MKKRKIIEVIQGYVSIGDTSHIYSDVKFGQLTWGLPIIYKENPNPDNFRHVQITYEEI